MARRVEALVKAPLLVWARESAGFSVDEAALKAKVNSARLESWERGEARPTVPQLRKLAKVYKRPLSVFFLPEPPPQPEPIHDFRRLPDQEPPPTSPALRLEIRRAYRRRLIASELLHEQLARPPLVEIPRAALNEDPEYVGQVARNWLNVRLEDQFRWSGAYKPLNEWISAFEHRGILVFQTSKVPLKEMRGFSLSEPHLPVIVLNANDPPRGRVFSLLHEFTHLMLNLSGLCEPERVSWRARTQDESVEVFCNHAAGAALVPARDLLRQPSVEENRQRLEWDDETLSFLADLFTVSREVILRRMLILERTTHEFYEQKRAQFQEEYRRIAERREEEEEGEERRYPPYYRVIVRNVGRAFARLVVDAFERDRITPAEVSDYLGIKLKHLDDISAVVSR